MLEEEKYFTKLDELECNYIKGNFGQHLTIVQQHRPLPFTYLENIILDNPNFIDSKNNILFENAKNYLPIIIKEKKITAIFTIRECASSCNCHSKYNSFSNGAIWYKFGYKE